MTLPSGSQSPPRTAMRKLIRSKRTRLFLTGNDAWTDDIGLALHIPKFEDSIAVCKRLKLDEVECYYSFHPYRQGEFDFALPLRPTPSTPRAVSAEPPPSAPSSPARHG